MLVRKPMRVLFAFAGFLAVIAGLAACAVTGMPYQEARGSDVATVRVASQGWDVSSGKHDPNARILQVDGYRVPQYLPSGLTIAGGIRYVGIEVSAGGSSVRQCVSLLAKSGQRYLIRVAGPAKDWAVTITNEEMGGDAVAPLNVVRMQRSCPESK